MTQQEIFDIVCTKFLQDPRKSASPNGACYYRGPLDTKCFIGMLLNDDEVKEGFTVWQLRLPEHLQGHECFLAELQAAHDAAYGYKYFRGDAEANLREVASMYKLATTVLDGAHNG